MSKIDPIDEIYQNFVQFFVRIEQKRACRPTFSHKRFATAPFSYARKKVEK
jgi:hypothetical protein